MIGILALQGGIEEHFNSLAKIKNIKAVKIKKPEELQKLDGLILPGGESTTISKLIKKQNFLEPIIKMKKQGKAVWGTCAGLILMAKEIENEENICLGLIDIKVKRNAYGSQLDSFICKKSIPKISDQPIELIFIRAPIITDWGNDVKILTKINGTPVAARKDNLLVTAFHPELTNNIKFHQYFVEKLIK